MKKPKILRWTWEDLTGSEELDSYFIDEIRRTMLCVKASRNDGRWYLTALLARQSGYILTCPASDFCVIIYRLLEPVPLETLKSIPVEVVLTEHGEPVGTLATFMEWVRQCYVDKPMPVVAGEVPELHL